ncbi:MAG: hypothetical protein OXU66_03815 [Gammaproteobacteria bacterium]|nr:hypothetical protein [Gammaproteobacteria bacterium]MDD9896628.1 hypothetical protein [Gammaproteobacteria bacterium]MDD9958046.1 hypothetical protein [Gammaproteobacteria bacterium]
MQLKRVSALIAALVCSSLSFSQGENTYEVPRNEHGQPDFQGVWSTRFSTPLERNEGMPLILAAEMANGFAQAVYDNAFAGNTDPDIDILGPQTLAKVKGEFRSSVLVYPENGILPYNQHGIANSSFAYFKDDFGFDGPEQRPGVERCIEGWGAPPMRAFPYQIFYGFVQTPEKIAIVAEENSPLRVIHMDGATRPDAIRTFEGHSVGRWEGETLVVETTHYSDTVPERAATGRPMLISSEAKVIERFTRVSETELFYEYTVDDPVYYSDQFRGEFSFTWDDSGHIYEYACHEGNYSMTGALMGARVQEAEARAAENQ